MNGSRIDRKSILAVLLLFQPSVVLAGMPALVLTDIGRMRGQSISFFLVGLLFSAWAIRGIWNYLQKDFQSLPRLTYRKSLAVVTLWGLLFVIVLTMISGARELMTPGAWEQEGFTYRLTAEDSTTSRPEDEQEKPKDELLALRRGQLDKLKNSLWNYAAKHDGMFPVESSMAEITDERWQLPERFGNRYSYISGLHIDDPSQVMVYEPNVYEDTRLVLLSDGRVQGMQSNEFRAVMNVRSQR